MTRRSTFTTATIASLLSFAFVGCNSILENDPAVLADDTTDTTPTEPAADGGPGAQQVAPTPDGGTSTPTPPGTSDAGGCAAGQQRCDGVCVSMTDPLYGCGDPSCKPCASSHSTMACQGRTCVVSACDPGYADCNANPADGCETDLSKSTSCGACNAVCGAAAPLCAPAGGTFQCTNGCTPGAPLACGADCVDPLSSVNHCGGCNIKCPDVPNSTTSCAAGVCGFTCKPQFHACAGACKTKTDPTACGPDCVVCPVPANGRATCAANTCGFACNAGFTKCGDRCVASPIAPNDPNACGPTCAICPARPNSAPTCTGGACTFACAAGFAHCDANVDNGCETNTNNDPLHCGGCNRPCAAGQPCVNGVCQAAPPPPPP